MTKRIIITLCTLCVTLTLPAQDTLRIMTYNAAIGVMGSMQQLGRYIRSKQPDIVALQEMDLFTIRPERKNSNNTNQPVELGFYTNMLPVFGPVLPYPSGGYYGLGFLSKHPILSVSNVPLPRIEGRDEPRLMLVATWDINGKQLTIASTHLSLDVESREKQMKFIRSYMQRIRGYKIICGDLNSTPEEQLVSKIFRRWSDALPDEHCTFSSWNPVYKYDWILYETKSDIQVLDAQVDTRCRLSDHLPCYVDIVIK
ncbi:MAG: endonuclease/exonuclease/phosphatase family protein [Paludibacteraceae bacterium]|nr:endonuclease/exonuclease/phosphatase family protein [Paludibacteraceae bacterium]